MKIENNNISIMSFSAPTEKECAFITPENNQEKFQAYNLNSIVGSFLKKHINI